MSTRTMLTAAQKRKKAIELRLRGVPWDDVADLVGYANAQNACRAVTDALAKYPAPAIAQLRQLEEMKLDLLEAEAWSVLGTVHYATCAKGLVVDEDGEPVIDSAPRDRAMNTLLRIAQRRARLLGLDQPVKIEIDDGSVDPEIESVVAAIMETASL
jgi:hypothetical protein